MAKYKATNSVTGEEVNFDWFWRQSSLARRR